MALTKLPLWFLVGFGFVEVARAWSGNVCSYSKLVHYRERYCSVYVLWGCWHHSYRWTYTIKTAQKCCHGWTSSSDYRCVIPVCSSRCIANGGTCQAPETCRCPSTKTGPNCETATCSYRNPCYPGDCYETNRCACSTGFGGSQRCLAFQNITKMRPHIQMSTAGLSHIRRSDGKKKFEFAMDGSTNMTTDVVWLNQRVFNTLDFQFQSFFEIYDLPSRPVYVHESGFGIVKSQVLVVISSIRRQNQPGRRIAFNKTYTCEGVTSTNPKDGLSNCTIKDENFKTLIEHGDWLTVTFEAENGGFRRLTNLDTGSIYETQAFVGLEDKKSVQFRFDFDAPKHCMETQPPCPNEPLQMQKDLTKDPIQMIWGGWVDDLSGILEYYLEIFHLKADAYDELTEEHPLIPVYRVVIPESDIHKSNFTPATSGMYSVLLEARDMANNTKIARRLVLYDPSSNVSLNQGDDGKMFVSSAVPETGYMWQTSVNNDSKITIAVEWSNHFKNKLHEDNMLLNKVKPYPIQFKEIQEDGILMTEKFVYPGMDDTEGSRTVSAINNMHGIVKFEVNKVFTSNTKVPTDSWDEISPIQETLSFEEVISDGGKARIWVRATDVMGNTNVDFTEVHFDTTPPNVGNRTELIQNFQNGTFDYTTRIHLEAVDDNSGVHKLGYRIYITMPGEEFNVNKVHFNGTHQAHMGKYDSSVDLSCRKILDTCFYIVQTLDLDNCWFMVDKDKLDVASAYVDIDVYNQALLRTTKRFKIDNVNHLKGLEKYSGPSNIRVVESYSNGVRLGWDIPEKASCYGRADIVLILYDSTTNESRLLNIDPESTYFDVLGLRPEQSYSVKLGLQLGSSRIGEINYAFKTASEESPSGLAAGPIAGIVIVKVAKLFPCITAVLVVIGLLIGIFVVLLRRGHMQPIRKRLDAVTVRYRSRKSMMAERNKTIGGKVNHTYEANRASVSDDMYVYGGMSFDTTQPWHLYRTDVTFESLLKTGHFANIYKVKLSKWGRRELAVAKTLKEGYTKDDKTLMMAKINFCGTKVGSHPNVLAFHGAVIEDEGVGPFIVYEFCENGNLRDHLVANKTNLTIELQENLFRFGLDIAKGMDYLTDQGIVHRRLAARNMLLTFLNEVKIAGFGPQPVEQTEDGDAETGKKERIPVKWMPPECMDSTKDATEKSDVWSYGVLLWEIFSLVIHKKRPKRACNALLAIMPVRAVKQQTTDFSYNVSMEGDQPYPNIRSRDLPAHLKKGGRLQKPESCDDTWYGVMQRTWSLKPAKRPTFKEIRDELDAMFVQSSEDDNYYYSRK